MSVQFQPKTLCKFIFIIGTIISAWEMSMSINKALFDYALLNEIRGKPDLLVQIIGTNNKTSIQEWTRDGGALSTKAIVTAAKLLGIYPSTNDVQSIITIEDIGLIMVNARSN